MVLQMAKVWIFFTQVYCLLFSYFLLNRSWLCSVIFLWVARGIFITAFN